MAMSIRRAAHFTRLIFWSVQIPIAMLTDLKNSVAYVVLLSLAAPIESVLTSMDQTVHQENAEED
jgi:hypothetical protein